MIEAAVAGDAFIRVVDLIDLHEEDRTDFNPEQSEQIRSFRLRHLGDEASQHQPGQVRTGVQTSTPLSYNGPEDSVRKND